MSVAVAIGVRSVSHLKACYEWVSHSGRATCGAIAASSIDFFSGFSKREGL
jgi:hypothetical protein